MSNGRWTVDANSLRRAAEHADGYRDKPLYLYYRANKLGNGDNRVGVVVHVTHKDAEKAGDEPLPLEVYTPQKGDGMGHPEKVVVHYKNYKESDLMACDFDSIFWTQSAVEKFLIPYYASIYDQYELEELRKASQQQTTLCFGHRFPTVYEPNPYCDGSHGPYSQQTNVLYIVLAEADKPKKKKTAKKSKGLKVEEKQRSLTVLPFQEYVRRKLGLKA